MSFWITLYVDFCVQIGFLVEPGGHQFTNGQGSACLWPHLQCWGYKHLPESTWLFTHGYWGIQLSLCCLASKTSAESSSELVPLQLSIAGVNIFSLGLFPHPYPGQGLLRAPKFPLINSYSSYNGTYSIRLWRLQYLWCIDTGLHQGTWSVGFFWLRSQSLAPGWS